MKLPFLIRKYYCYSQKWAGREKCGLLVASPISFCISKFGTLGYLAAYSSFVGSYCFLLAVPAMSSAIWTRWSPEIPSSLSWLVIL